MEEIMHKFEFLFYDEKSETYFRDDFNVTDYGNIEKIKDQIDLVARDILRRANSMRKEFNFDTLILLDIKDGLRNEDRTINQFFELIADLKAEEKEEIEEEARGINIAFRKLNALTMPINLTKTMRELTC
jgi:hypothetical protein